MSSLKTLIRKKLVLIFEERKFFFHQRTTYTLYDFKFPSIMVELYMSFSLCSCQFFHLFLCSVTRFICVFSLLDLHDGLASFSFLNFLLYLW